MAKQVYLFLAEGFEEIEALTPVDVLRRASINIVMVSVTDRRQVTGARGITVTADAMFDDIADEDADMIILPGGMPGAKNLQEHEGLKQLLLRYAKAGKLIGTICAAPMIPGDLGLLKNKKATCYPGFEKHLKGAKISSRPVEKSDNFITGKGVGAALQFSLELVAQLTDSATAQELAKKMVAS